MTLRLENAHAVCEIGPTAEDLRLVDRRSGADYCAHKPSGPGCAGCPPAGKARPTCAMVKQGGRYHRASAAHGDGGLLTLEFGDAGVRAAIRGSAQPEHFLFEVLEVTGEQVEELVFADLHLTRRATGDDDFACCALALNLQTNVRELPGATKRLWAACYPRFGFVGAKVAVIACPHRDLRRVMQEVASAAEELPHSPIGGPWALDAPINRGSYLFNFRDLSERTVDEWIELARSFGFNQIDFHGGESFRFGDCRPNPETYPQGFASLRAVVDRLHAAGLQAGLHTYAFFIDKSCPWVTPRPDPRLGRDATFTLAAGLSEQADEVQVEEPTTQMSAVTGFFVRNSVTLQIDEELITYGGVRRDPPYAFIGCTRGACGTRVAPHERGAKAHHLKECFGLLTPDGDSTLLAEVAAKTAAAFNQCGFDMIYLDALDGEDILGGAENGWHYGSKFVFELWRRLEKPALMEMSTFHHHLWYVRSRMGAWDHPSRSHKRFIDLHCAANQDNRRMFLPGQLGWWAAKTWSGAQGEPTFADDIEYLCCKALGADTGLSLMGVAPDRVRAAPALARLGEIMKRYEGLRRDGYFPESIKERLRAPGREFSLSRSARGRWRLQPVQYAKHRVEGIDGWSNTWRIANRLGRQPLQLRIEALLAAGPYDAPDDVTLADFSAPAEFTDRASQSGVQAELRRSTERIRAGLECGCFTAASTRRRRRSAWARIGKAFAPPLDLSERQALGVWVHGDGRGAVLNFQLRCPEHLVAGIGDHYVIVDFAGWRYFELIEPEGERYDDYSWPYGSPYSIYRESVDYGHVASLSVWCNNLPPGETVACHLSPVRALPLVKVRLRSPAVTVAGRTIVFPVEMDSGSYLEFRSRSACKLYDSEGRAIDEVAFEGELPWLERGLNQVRFECDAPDGVNARARVTIVTEGRPLRG